MSKHFVLLNIVAKLCIERGDVFSIYHRQIMVPLQGFEHCSSDYKADVLPSKLKRRYGRGTQIRTGTMQLMRLLNYHYFIPQ